jgi:RimJ/RimL family protein N-acetyltransferase
LSTLKQFCKWAASKIVGEYSPYFIYQWNGVHETKPADRENPFEIKRIERLSSEAAMPLVQEQADYLGEESIAFGCFEGGQLTGVCFYWFGERYKTRNFWPLKGGEAKLVQIIVAPSARGRGVAPELIRASGMQMRNAGFENLFARIWHSNNASISAFKKAGWGRVAFVLEFKLSWWKKPKKVRWNLT